MSTPGIHITASASGYELVISMVVGTADFRIRTDRGTVRYICVRKTGVTAKSIRRGVSRQGYAGDIYSSSRIVDRVTLHLLFKTKTSTLFAIMVLPAERLSAVVGHLNPTKATGRANLLRKNPDDIVNILRNSRSS